MNPQQLEGKHSLNTPKFHFPFSIHRVTHRLPGLVKLLLLIIFQRTDMKHLRIEPKTVTTKCS